MNKLYVKYKEITLGELSFDNGLYSYYAYADNVSVALNKGYPIFLYFVEKDFVSDHLPRCLNDFIPKDNSQMFYEANLKQTDTNFEKLLKVASLPLYDGGLYISLEY